MRDGREQCLTQAIRILTRGRQTKEQLKKKLKAKGYEAEIIEFVLAECETNKYLNDPEFAILWVEDRNKLRPTGRWRLRNEMLQKGIDGEIIGKVLDEILPLQKEQSLLKQLFQEKWEGNETYQKKPQKLVNFLLRRGFSKDQIFRVAENLGIDIWEYKQT